MADVPIRGTKGNKSASLASSDTGVLPNLKLSQLTGGKSILVADENGNIMKDSSPFFDVSIVDLTNASHYYYGGMLLGQWNINRFNTATLTKTSANTGAVDLATAWANRTTLTYT
jgi:hypothetical protein